MTTIFFRLWRDIFSIWSFAPSSQLALYRVVAFTSTDPLCSIQCQRYYNLKGDQTVFISASIWYHPEANGRETKWPQPDRDQQLVFWWIAFARPNMKALQRSSADMREKLTKPSCFDVLFICRLWGLLNIATYCFHSHLEPALFAFKNRLHIQCNTIQGHSPWIGNEIL